MTNLPKRTFYECIKLTQNFKLRFLPEFTLNLVNVVEMTDLPNPTFYETFIFDSGIKTSSMRPVVLFLTIIITDFYFIPFNRRDIADKYGQENSKTKRGQVKPVLKNNIQNNNKTGGDRKGNEKPKNAVRY